jgi:hypothetical protein
MCTLQSLPLQATSWQRSVPDKAVFGQRSRPERSSLGSCSSRRTRCGQNLQKECVALRAQLLKVRLQLHRFRRAAPSKGLQRLFERLACVLKKLPPVAPTGESLFNTDLVRIREVLRVDGTPDRARQQTPIAACLCQEWMLNGQAKGCLGPCMRRVLLCRRRMPNLWLPTTRWPKPKRS